MSVKRRNTPGCPCCTSDLGNACTPGDGICVAPNSCECVVVEGCNAEPFGAGIPVVFTQGANTWTVNTDVNGRACVCAVSGVSITAAVSGVARFNSGSLTWTAGTAHSGLVLTPASGYHCVCKPFPLAVGGGGTCLYPVKDTLVWSDSCAGTFPLTYGAGKWTGGNTCADPGIPSLGIPPGTGSLTVDAFDTGLSIYDCDVLVSYTGPSASFGVLANFSSMTCGTPSGFAVAGSYSGTPCGCSSSGTFLITE